MILRVRIRNAVRKMPTLSTVLLSVSASTIQIRLLYGNGNENRSFYHDGSKQISSLGRSSYYYQRPHKNVITQVSALTPSTQAPLPKTTTEKRLCRHNRQGVETAVIVRQGFIYIGGFAVDASSSAAGAHITSPFRGPCTKVATESHRRPWKGHLTE